ncbi:MAG: hypothetical protein SFY80_10395 [Verrucomicrobiota bacterium]|nr:hypothetical protein [Verrucomicrobiota bacterium]
MENEEFRRKVAEIKLSHAEAEREAERREKKSEVPLAVDYLTAVLVVAVLWLWKGEENSEFSPLFILIVILAIPIKRRLRKDWPESLDCWWMYPLERFQFTVALAISSAVVLPSYFFIIKPLAT